MGHVAKFKGGAVGNLSKHYERKQDENGEYVKFNNENIDTSKSHLNYNLAPNRNMPQTAFIKQRKSEVYCLNRKNVNVMCAWVLTAPKDLPQTDEKAFFKQSYDFLEERYGKENVVSSYVHNDEATPHMHFAFVPVVYDKEKQCHKVSAKEKVTRMDLKAFHKDWSNHLEEHFGRTINVINEATKEGNKAVEELKRESASQRYKKAKEVTEKASDYLKKAQPHYDNIKKLKSEINSLNDNLESKKSVLSKIDEFEQIDVKKSIIGNKVTLANNDFQTLQSLAVESTTLKLENQELRKENRTLKTQFKDKMELYKENIDLRKDVDRYKNAISRLPEQIQHKLLNSKSKNSQEKDHSRT